METAILFKIAAVGLIVAILNMVLKKSDKDEISTIVTIIGLIIVTFFVVDMIVALFDTLKEILALY